MKEVMIKQTLGNVRDTKVKTTIGMENSPLGKQKSGAINILVTNVPDEVKPLEVVRAYERTSVWHMDDSCYKVPFDRLGAGNLVKVGVEL